MTNYEAWLKSWLIMTLCDSHIASHKINQWNKAKWANSLMHFMVVSDKKVIPACWNMVPLFHWYAIIINYESSMALLPAYYRKDTWDAWRKPVNIWSEGDAPLYHASDEPLSHASGEPLFRASFSLPNQLNRSGLRPYSSWWIAADGW